jgi:multicomponent K+:H+ antiporter subunit G
MSQAADVSPLIAALCGMLVLLGASLTLIGALGLLRLAHFYDRLHAPTLGATAGTGLILIASLVLSSSLELRLVLHQIAIGVLMLLTTPVTFMLLLRAAVHRDGRS